MSLTEINAFIVAVAGLLTALALFLAEVRKWRRGVSPDKEQKS